ncbi:ABC transporter ATP-binding protein [Nonomuraea rubra]|uniref:ABC transporter ATP-binding protein n=1 Tax=Nonomuraea rubra TaxID=46180 RepID=UPI00340FB094
MTVVSRPADSGPVLRADAVELVRDGRHLLRDISLTVNPGEHWALLGANGAGKSTLLSLLGAVTHPSGGVVQVLGRTMGRVDVRELRSYLGHVNPRHTPDGPLRVRDVVLTGLTGTAASVPRWTPTRQESERADQLIAMLGMSHRAQATWATLSQGERGRALIARGLMPQPRLLLLDEPATGLDLAAREQLLAGIDALRAQHPSLATVLVTHHLEELPATTTHAMLLRDGRCLAGGPVAGVLTSELVSACFDHPVRLVRSDDGRWAARAEPVSMSVPV